MSLATQISALATRIGQEIKTIKTSIFSISASKSTRDFSNGTLIKSDIDYSQTNGVPWLLEIEANTYGQRIPAIVKVQGYIYADTIIQYGGISLGTPITGIVATNVDGKLCFWFPRQGYWQGYTVFIGNSYDGTKVNGLVSITDEVKPPSNKEVDLSASIIQGWNSNNFDPNSKAAADHGDHGMAAHKQTSEEHPRDTRSLAVGAKAVDADLLDGKHVSDLYALTSGTTAAEIDNVALAAGMYRLELQAVAGLPGMYFYVYHSGQYSGSGYASQMAIPFGGGEMTSIYFRVSVGQTWGTWVAMWNSLNDGTGSGLDADLLDGYHATAFAAAEHGDHGMAAHKLTSTEHPRDERNLAVGAKAADSDLLDGYLHAVEVKRQVNTVTNNLGTPSVEEMALFHGQFTNKMRFFPADLQEQSTDGINWTPSTRATPDQLKDLMLGEGQTGFLTAIPISAIGGSGYYRLNWYAPGYCSLQSFYLYGSASGNSVNVKIEKYNTADGWTPVASGEIGGWPEHTYIPHDGIWFLNNAQSLPHHGKVRVTFWITSSNYATNFDINAIEWFGGYPAGRRNVEHYDSDQNVYFPAAITGSRLISSVATGSPPLDVASTTVVPNLNADLLDGNHATAFAAADHGDHGMAAALAYKYSRFGGQLYVTGHTFGDNICDVELYAESGTEQVELSIRFHQGGRYYKQIRARADGFRFTEGNDNAYVDIRAAAIYSNENRVWDAGNFEPTTKAAADHGDHGVAAHKLTSQEHPRDERSLAVGAKATDSDMVDGKHGNEIPFIHAQNTFGGNMIAITTDEFITMLDNLGAFNSRSFVVRGSWNYAGNQIISDTGCGNIHLAGAVIEVISETAEQKMIRITTPTTVGESSAQPSSEFIYISHGIGYSPGWRRSWNSYNFDPATKAAADHGDHGMAAHKLTSTEHPRDARNQVAGSYQAAGSYEPAFSKNTAFNDNYGTAALTVCVGNDARLSDARTPSATSVDYAKVANSLKQKSTVTSTVDLSANGIGAITLSANTAFAFTGFELNKSYLLIITVNGFTPSWATAAKHVAVEGNGAFATSGVFYVSLTCIDTTSGSEKLLTTIMKGA